MKTTIFTFVHVKTQIYTWRRAFEIRIFACSMMREFRKLSNNANRRKTNEIRAAKRTGFTSTYIHTYIHMHIQRYIHTRIYIHMYICTYTYTYKNIHIYSTDQTIAPWIVMTKRIGQSKHDFCQPIHVFRVSSVVNHHPSAKHIFFNLFEQSFQNLAFGKSVNLKC